jgi:hypothetical protein
MKAQMSDEEFKATMEELTRLYEAAMAASARSKAFIAEASKALGSVVIKHFPEVYRLEPKQYEVLKNILWKNADRLDTDLDNLLNGHPENILGAG